VVLASDRDFNFRVFGTFFLEEIALFMMGGSSERICWLHADRLKVRNNEVRNAFGVNA
jgi:hypothetical protein